MYRRMLAIVFAFLSLAVGAHAQTDKGNERAGRTASDLQVIVRAIDASALQGGLISLDGEILSLRDRSGKSRAWRISELRSLQVEPAPVAVDEIPPLVLLANGDSLRGSIEHADEDTLTLNWTAVTPPTPFTLPLESVRSIVLRQPDDDLDRLRLRRIWTLLESQEDRLISIDNTHLDGKFLGLAEGQVRLESSLGVFTAPVQEVNAVVMNSNLVSTPEQKGPYQLLSFRDGSRLTAASLRQNDEGMLSVTAVWGTEIAFPLESVSRVQFLGDRVIPLSDLSPQQYKFTPYLTQEYPLVVNRNVHGGRLRLRGEMFATGLGVSSKSEVTYDLQQGRYAAFEAIVGVDDMTEGQGNVVFAVELDGKRVFESTPLDGRSPQKVVGPLDVSRSRRLKLIVDYGQFGNIQDVANWCDAVLIKQRD